MHPAINTTRESAYTDMRRKHQCFITYLVTRNRAMAKRMLEKMKSGIKFKNKKPVPGSLADFEKMQTFRNELNAERKRVVGEK